MFVVVVVVARLLLLFPSDTTNVGDDGWSDRHR